MARRWRVGVDVGGTFTDVAVHDLDSGEMRIFKVPTTPSDPSLGVLDGLRYAGQQMQGAFVLGDVEHFLHGTTITTNALIVRSYPPCGLLVTEGLRGAVQVQDQRRVGNTYDLSAGHPESLVDEEHVFEVPERLDRQGNVVRALDRAAVAEIGARIRDHGLTSVAVCLLFSYVDPTHEEQVGEILREVCPDLRISLSSRVLPRIREWPRISTMLLNASLEPLLVDYVDRLGRALVEQGLDFSRLFLMESNGGLMPFSAVVGGGRAVHTLLSGPAAAVQAAIAIAGSSSDPSLLTLDVGGTSADVAFVHDGVALEVTEGRLVGHEIYVPMLDVTTIGAGGGTISRVTDEGRLRVGPYSAGADPGPACYGRGGVEPTTTDADLVLGLLDPEYYVGGRMALDVGAATRAIESRVAGPLGLSVLEAATTMIRINDVHMADAVRVFAAQRGVDLGGAALVACGGAGPLHAASVAEELGMRRVLVPEHPGAFSAVGLLCTNVVQDFVQTELTPLQPESAPSIAKRFLALEGKAVDDLESQGFGRDAVVCRREVDARYAGQGFELRLVLSTAESSDPALIREMFHAEHKRIYGHAAGEELVEIVSYRVRAEVAMPTFVPGRSSAPEDRPSRSDTRWRAVYAGGAWTDARIIMRHEVVPGTIVVGPVVVEQPDTTTFVPPGWSLRCEAGGTLVLDRGTE